MRFYTFNTPNFSNKIEKMFNQVTDDILNKIPMLEPETKSDNKEYEYTISHAGIDPKDISVQVTDGVLNVSTKETTRTFILPDNVDSTKIEAKSEHGLLTIKVGKKDKPEPKKIEIKF